MTVITDISEVHVIKIKPGQTAYFSVRENDTGQGAGTIQRTSRSIVQVY